VDEHVHTGFVTFFWVGLYAVLWIWAARLIAAKMLEYSPTAPVGKALGGLVHFGS
jgi:hypothetical protein